MKCSVTQKILHNKHNKLDFYQLSIFRVFKKMPKEKKSKKEKKEKKEKSHKEKKEKHSSKNKDNNAMEVDVISPISEESTQVKTNSDKGLIVHYDLKALVPFAQPLASEELTREIMIVIRRGNYISYKRN